MASGGKKTPAPTPVTGKRKAASMKSKAANARPNFPFVPGTNFPGIQSVSGNGFILYADTTGDRDYIKRRKKTSTSSALVVSTPKPIILKGDENFADVISLKTQEAKKSTLLLSVICASMAQNQFFVTGHPSVSCGAAYTQLSAQPAANQLLIPQTAQQAISQLPAPLQSAAAKLYQDPVAAHILPGGIYATGKPLPFYTQKAQSLSMKKVEQEILTISGMVAVGGAILNHIDSYYENNGGKEAAARTISYLLNNMTPGQSLSRELIDNAGKLFNHYSLSSTRQALTKVSEKIQELVSQGSTAWTKPTDAPEYQLLRLRAIQEGLQYKLDYLKDDNSSISSSPEFISFSNEVHNAITQEAQQKGNRSTGSSSSKPNATTTSTTSTLTSSTPTSSTSTPASKTSSSSTSGSTGSSSSGTGSGSATSSNSGNTSSSSSSN